MNVRLGISISRPTLVLPRPLISIYRRCLQCSQDVYLHAYRIRYQRACFRPARAYSMGWVRRPYRRIFRLNR